MRAGLWLLGAAALLFLGAAIWQKHTPPVKRLALEESRALRAMEETFTKESGHPILYGANSPFAPAPAEDGADNAPDEQPEPPAEQKKEFIKWVEFNIPYSALKKAMSLDVKYHGTNTPMPWIDMLSLLACKYGGDFSRYRETHLIDYAERVKQGESTDAMAEGLQYYSYYKEAYTAVLGGFVGEFTVEVPNEGDSSHTHWETRYGLKAFSPIARGYDYGHYDDFGQRRSYGYARPHLGHDLLGAVGTPIIAVESGVVEAVGWNQYGGWRIGIRSLDSKRYYYYAHLRKNHPYHSGLEVGQVVTAGDVIGYLGMTGYSIKENVNNIKTPHLHVGMQLIFDESQKDSVNEIWVDLYDITRLLSLNTSAVYKNEAEKEYYRRYGFFEGLPEDQVEAPSSLDHAFSGGDGAAQNAGEEAAG